MADTVADKIAGMMDALGLDRSDHNFTDTPRRVSSMYSELLRGHHDDLWYEVKDLLSQSFGSNYDGIVSITGIDAVGVCPHHLLPVQYKVCVGYIPNGQMVGLSKIPRVVKLLAARPVLQEQFTEEISDSMAQIPQCQGAIVLVRGHHSCMSIRGVRATNCDTITSSVKGVFAEDPSTKAEFLSLTNNGQG